MHLVGTDITAINVAREGVGTINPTLIFEYLITRNCRTEDLVDHRAVIIYVVCESRSPIVGKGCINT